VTGAFAGGLLGCSAPTSKTALQPDGPPNIFQIFVTERDPATGDTSLGLYLNANPEFDVDADMNGKPDLLEQNGDDGVVTNAVVDGTQTVRIVFDELLDGSTLEEFFCACSAAATGCPTGTPDATLDPSMCADNPDSAANELGEWLDANGDGLPDKARLLPGLVTVTCDGTAIFTNATGDAGFYNPSGNQDIPVATGLLGLGPALVATVTTGLKTNADCAIAVTDKVKDKDGNAVPAPDSSKKFHTESMTVLSSVPADMATGVKLNIAPAVSFNAILDMDTINGIKLEKDVGGVRTAVQTTNTLAPNMTEVDMMPAANLEASTDYVITVPVTVTDTFGGAFPAAQEIKFTTGTM
jgi:hypothetical protein